MRWILILLLILLPSLAWADPEQCREAIDVYKEAVSEFHDTQEYLLKCVANNQGEDDCHSKYRSFQDAVSELESKKSDMESECPY